MIVLVTYGIGYGSHIMELEFDDDATTEQIKEEVHDFVMERVDYGYEIQP